MSATDITNFITELRTELEKLPQRPARGELLRRAREIPLRFPEAEFNPGLPVAGQLELALKPWGGKVHGVAGGAEGVAKALEIMTEAGAKRASRWHSERLDGLGLESGLAPLGLEWIQFTPDEVRAASDPIARRAMIHRLATIDVGIIDCDWAVAHTGSLVVRHTAERNGLTNLLPWHLIAFVWASQVVPAMQDAIDLLDREHATRPWEKGTVFITGPSRSGDIDLRVGQGAAGPGRHHLIVIQD